MTIYLVRHAPTAANHGGVFMGQSDVLALELESPETHRVAPGRARAIYTSPLQRATSAAEALFPGERAVVSELLLERSVGEWEGLDHATVESRWPGTFVDGALDPAAASPKGGETIADLCDRVVAFFDLLAQDPSDADVYAVTHNGWIRAAMLLNAEIAFEDLFAESVPFLTPIPFTPEFAQDGTLPAATPGSQSAVSRRS